MNQCPKCGTEFEGKFCPECGTQWVDPTVCPKCGAKLTPNAKFCAECGYSAAEPQTQQKCNKAAPFAFLQSRVLFRVLEWLPAVLFVLFAALTFAFLAAPVMVANLFGFGGTETAYEVLKDSDAEFLKPSVIALIVFGALSLVIALFLLYTAYKGRKTKVVFVAFAFYLAELIIASVMIGLVKKQDGGMGVLKAGACQTLIIVFAVIFAFLTICALLAEKYLQKNAPADMLNTNTQTNGETNQPSVKNIYDQPVPPEPVEKPSLYRELRTGTAPVILMANSFTARKLLPWFILLFGCLIALPFMPVTLYNVIPGTTLNVLSVFLAIFAVAVIVILSVCLSLHIKQKHVTVWNKRERSAVGYWLSLFVSIAVLICLITSLNLFTQSISAEKINYAAYSIFILTAIMSPFVVASLILSIIALVRQGSVNEAIYGFKRPKSDTPARVAFAELNKEYLEYAEKQNDYENYKIALAQYRYKMRCYSRGLNYHAKRSPIRLRTDQILMSVMAIVLAVTLLVPCIAFPVAANKFRIGFADSIKLNDYPSYLSYSIPEPDRKTGYVWEYYSGNYKKILNKIEANAQKAETIQDLNELEKLMQTELKLSAQLESITYKYIGITFSQYVYSDGQMSNDYYVSRVLFDTNRCDSATTVKKQVKKVLLAADTIEREEMFVYNFGIGAKIYYKDGSFQKCWIPSSAYTDVDPFTAGTYLLTWSDAWGDYSATLTLT